jgi:phosphoserine phosphatase SerB
MTPRGQQFLLKIGADDSVLSKVMALREKGLIPTLALRTDAGLIVSLVSPASIQRLADVVGPGVAVGLETSSPRGQSPPGSDWLLRIVAQKPLAERSIDRVLTLLKEISDEIGGIDCVEIRVAGGTPAVVDLRISTDRHIEFETQKARLLDLGEKLGLGMLLQPLSLFMKPKGLVCFDLDSTLVREELIVEVAKRVGKEAEVEKITEMAMAGDLDYNGSFIRRVSLLRGISQADLEDIWRGVKPQKGVMNLLGSLRMGGVRTALLSGAFTFFTERARDMLGLDFAIGNDVEMLNGHITGIVTGEIVNAGVKTRKMRDLAAELNLTLDEVVAVGDGANDIEIVKEAGTGIAYNKGGLVRASADAVLPDGQLANMLFLLGGSFRG